MEKIKVNGDVIIENFKKRDVVNLIVNCGFPRDFAEDVRRLPKGQTFKISDRSIGTLKVTKITKGVYEFTFVDLETEK